MKEPMRILLVDDHALFRQGVAGLLAGQDDMLVVGEATDGCEAIVQARSLAPDVILMDLSMPGCSGVEAVRTIKRESPRVHIVMLTVCDKDKDLFAALKAGADGYLLKNLQPQQLLRMLAGIRRGEAAISGAMAAKMLHEFRDAPAAPEETLSSREIQVLELLANGASNKEIAASLALSEYTVKNYVVTILEKLHLHNRVQAAVYAVRHGLAEGGSDA